MMKTTMMIASLLFLSYGYLSILPATAFSSIRSSFIRSTHTQSLRGDSHNPTTNAGTCTSPNRIRSMSAIMTDRQHQSQRKSKKTANDDTSYSNINKYIRIVPKRLLGNQQSFELQTAVVTFVKSSPNTKNTNYDTNADTQQYQQQQQQQDIIDLHAQLHFGEYSYFDYFNQQSFQSLYDAVFYELILSQNLLQPLLTSTSSSSTTNTATSTTINHNPIHNDSNVDFHSSDLRVLKNNCPISPSLQDLNTAAQYGLACQVDVIDYAKPKWIHCDVTREQFQHIFNQVLDQHRHNYNTNTSTSTSSNTNFNSSSIYSVLASTAATPIQQFTSALFRPSTPTTYQNQFNTPTTLPTSTDNSPPSPSSSTTFRLFTNLFLPGNTLSTLFRILFWSFIPTPELNVILLDWSSINDPKPTGFISSIFVPVLKSLLTGNIMIARRLIFAQLIVSGQVIAGRDLLLVKKRNDVAMDILKEYFSMDNSHPTTRTRRSAILYGASHCRDLQQKLAKLGYYPTKVDWRCAWSMKVPSFGTSSNVDNNNYSISTSTTTPTTASSPTINKKRGEDPFAVFNDFASINDPTNIAIGLVVIPFYLMIGGLDWLSTWHDVIISIESHSWLDAVSVFMFYLMRHVALYLGLVKFVVEWDGEVKLFG